MRKRINGLISREYEHPFDRSTLEKLEAIENKVYDKVEDTFT